MDFEFIEELGKKYISYQVQSDDVIDQVALEMINHNEFSNMVPFSVLREDGKIYYRYNVTGLKKLEDLKGNGITKRALIKMLKDILSLVEECQDHLISLTQIIIDENLFFFEKKGPCVKLIISPIEKDVDDINSKLLQVMKAINFNEKDADYVVDIWNYFKKAEAFSVVEFGELIKNIEESGPDVIDNENYDDIFAENYDFGPKVLNGKVVSGPSTETEMAIPIPADSPKNEKVQKDSILHKIGKLVKPPKEKIAGDEEKEPPKSNEKSSTNKNSLLNNIKIPGLIDKPENKDDSDKEVPVNNAPVIDNKVEMEERSVKQETMGTIFEYEVDTTGLKYEEDIVPDLHFSLYRVSTGEVFDIKNGENKIGRKPEDVDIHVGGNTHVGRIHASLFFDGKTLTVKDNNSANGTFINGVRLTNEKDEDVKELYTGDKLVLGDEELIIR